MTDLFNRLSMISKNANHNIRIQYVITIHSRQFSLILLPRFQMQMLLLLS